ncbi:CapA family protein [Mangrovibacillus cuniculi]|uniref:CapA family protein n=1 Tax=Mangrovibacillus cuniculi TaxID=2593652 RepID=A0A7S8CBD6_9BACI|nr:CapA family protein [Mangrovibacillus cuniculi]QPC46848.1 CapA family protein [Mangrovibacillus cuniculi]
MTLVIMFYLVGCNSIPSDLPIDAPSSEEEVMSEKVSKAPYSPPLIDFLKKKPKVYEKETSPFVVSFVGDVMMDWSVKGAIEKYGPDFPWKDVTPILSASDISIANLETAVTTRGIADDKQYAFRSAPDSLKGLANAGVDIVSLANNHSLDYGVEGLLDTFDYITASGMRYIGAGKSEEEAYQSIEMTLGGEKLVF